MEATTIHEAVREHYGELARTSSSCCASGSSTLYDENLIQAVPTDISGFSLGCGDPITLAKLQPGEIVLDLGSGGGLDCFLAAKQVGATGRAIGVDMTWRPLHGRGGDHLNLSQEKHHGSDNDSRSGARALRRTRAHVKLMLRQRQQWQQHAVR